MAWLGLGKLFRASSDGPKTFDDAIRDAGFDPLDIIYPGGVVSRDRAAGYSAVHRAVTLISGSVASAVTESLRVVEGRTGKVVDSPPARRVLDLLTDTPDGVTPAYQFLEDAVSDLLMSGSSVVIVREAFGRPRLTLANPMTAHGHAHDDGSVTFDLISDDEVDGTTRVYPSSKVIIARWPRVAGRSIGRSSRTRWFGTPPIVSMRGAIALALGAEKWASALFDRKSGAIGSDYAIVWPGVLPKAAQENLHRMLAAFGDGRSPLILDSGASVTKLNSSAQDNDLLNLRKFQLGEISRCYGVPSILLGLEDSGNVWGSSTSALERIFLRYSAKLHLNRLLTPLAQRLLPKGMRLVVDEGRAYRGDAEALKSLMDSGRPDGKGKPGILTRSELRNLAGFEDDYIDDYDMPTPKEPPDGDRE